MKGLAYMAGGIAATLVVGTVLWTQFSGGNPAAASGPPLSGDMERLELVDLEAPTLTAALPDGTQTSLDDYAGQVVLVNFWATWCPPCVAEMPSLDRLQAALGDEGLVVMPVSIDLDGMLAVAPFYQSTQLEHLGIYLDPQGSSPRSFDVPGLPTSVVIDREGRWVATFAGDTYWDSDDAQSMLRWYLEQPAS